MAKIIKPFVLTTMLVLTMLSIGLARNIILLVKNAVSQPLTAVETFAAVSSGSAAEGFVTASYHELHEEPGITGVDGIYELFVEDKLVSRFDNLEDAITLGSDFAKSSIREKGKSRWLWDNYPSFSVYTGSESFREFYEFHQAAAYAKTQEKASIFYRKDNGLIWSNTAPLNGRAKIDAPHISQLPELPRGCEVTSLAMLLQTKGIEADKLTLASAVKKDHSPYVVKGGKIYYGNPNDGFVGDMYSFETQGLGVYHSPIHKLLEEYLPDSALDLTGCDFEDLFYFLENGAPVWVIVNSKYSPLPASDFITWHTPSGEIQVTYSEHSILVTGYDENRIYFNDPLGGRSSAARNSFVGAWEQMGRQAVTYTP